MNFDDYENVRALLADHAMGMPTFEDWRYRWVGNSHWQNTGGSLPIGWVLETSAGAIVGCIETIPTLYKFRGADLVAAASCAWCVNAAYRGYALQLVDEYFNQAVDLFISNTVNSDAVETLSHFYNPIPVGRWDMMSFFITEHVLFAKRALLKYRVPFAASLAYPAGWALRAKDSLAGKPVSEWQHSVIVETADNFDARFDTFWSELVEEYPDKLLAERSSRTLSWHFSEALRSNRLWILTTSKLGKMRGFCVLRVEASPGVGRRVVLVDYQSLEPGCDLLAGFLQTALQRCAAEGFYVLQNFGLDVPKMQFFDEHAPYRRKLPNKIFYFGAADSALESELRQPHVWDPSFFDGDATL
jgi:hypothetical protein